MFSLGQTVATVGALAALVASGQNPEELIARHIAGDFGELDEEDNRSNLSDIAGDSGRVLSAYRLADGRRLWIITNLIEGEGYDTCLLVPTDY